MTELERKEIMMNAFNNELVKMAAWSSIFKGLMSIGKFTKNTFGTKGKLLQYAKEGYRATKGGGDTFKAFTDFASKYATPGFKKVVQGGKQVVDKIDTTPTNSGFIQSHIGDAAKWINELKTGINSQNGLLKNIRIGAKNMWNAEKKDWFSGGYGTKGADKMFTENGKEYVKHFGFKRRVVGKTYDAAGNVTGYNFKKTLPTKLLNAGMTPIGMVGTSMAFGALAGASPSDSFKEGLKESLFWTPATKIIGFGKMMTDIPSMVGGLVS
jgi:hypothetical protein